VKEDRAGSEYWNSVWTDKVVIHETDIDYYTNSLLHKLYKQFFKCDEDKSIVEIGCSLSANLLYFNKYYRYQINGFDYEKVSALKTQEIYEGMGYEANIYHRDFFSKDKSETYDVVSSFGVFEHFENLDQSIKQIKHYLKDDGIILTVIPNMNGVVGFFQKLLNRKVYDVHIPYTKEEILEAHKNAGFDTLFCNYYGLYQSGVINVSGIKYETITRKLLAIPGKPLYFLSKFFHWDFSSKIISPYVIYIGKYSK
jgi:cyclopropane fatty-acyl-phospholipid synthase-like methyltransferase